MAPTRRYRDLKVRYDLDFQNDQTIVRQRTYKTADGVIETPVTPLLAARVVAGDLPAPRVRRFTPRKGECCFLNPTNVTGASRLSVFCPYAPGDPNLAAHVKEMREVSTVESVRYFGEAHDLSVEPYL
jgi:hypothetical protein